MYFIKCVSALNLCHSYLWPNYGRLHELLWCFEEFASRASCVLCFYVVFEKSKLFFAVSTPSIWFPFVVFKYSESDLFACSFEEQTCILCSFPSSVFLCCRIIVAVNCVCTYFYCISFSSILIIFTEFNYITEDYVHQIYLLTLQILTNVNMRLHFII